LDEKKVIEVKCKGADTLPIDRILEFQGELKTLSKDNEKKLRNSILKFGFIAPFFVWDDKGEWRLLDGHQRLKTLLKMREEGYDIPLLPVDYIEADSEEDAKRKLLHITSQYGEFSPEGFENFTLELDGFENIRLTDGEFDISFLRDDDEVKDDNYEIPDEIETDIKVGDIFQIGKHRLMCGDSTSIDAVDNLMCGADWDVCVFDPPYEVESLYVDAMPPARTGKKILVMWDFKRFATAPAAALSAGWQPQYEFIWDCVQSWYTPNRPLQRHKAIGVFGDDPFFNTETSIIVDGKDRGPARTVRNTRGSSNYTPLDGAKHIATVEAFPNTQQRDDHGHGKPVAWIEAIFNGVGGAIYLDLFGGSGSTMIACEQLNRTCYMMELDPKYCQVIIDRMRALDGTIKIRRNGESYD